MARHDQNFVHKSLKKFKKDGLLFFIVIFVLYTECEGTTSNVATLSIEPKDQVIAHSGDTLIMNCMLTGLEQADQVWHVPWDYKYKEDPAQKERFTTQWTAQGILQLIISPLTYQDAGSYLCKSEAAGLVKTVLVWIPGPDPITADTCSHTQFRCGTGICIFLRFRCDRIVDCPDSSDEVGCDVSCDEEYRCDNGQCIQRELVCDQAKNCRDGSDEAYCRHKTFLPKPGDKLSTVSTPRPKHDPHNHQSWHFNAIYSAVAGVIGLVCVVAIVVITVCRIHMRKEALRQMWRPREDNSSRRSRHPAGSRLTSAPVPWQQHTPYYHDSSCEPYRQLHPPNVAINLNLQLGGVSEINNVMVTPPPYTEVEETSLNERPPPPPYSTLDRRVRVPNNGANNAPSSAESNTESANNNNTSSSESERLLHARPISNGAICPNRPRLTDNEQRESLLSSDPNDRSFTAVEENV